MLMASEVTIDHQKAAKEYINTAGDAALKRYKEISGRECKLDFQTEVSDESSGGIIGSVMNRRIKVDNTLDERLKILEEKVSPVISRITCLHNELGLILAFLRPTADVTRDQD